MKMYENQMTKTPLNILYDPRNMDTIYYIKGSELTPLHMNMDKPQNAGYVHMSEAEIKYYNAENLRISREGKKINRELNVIGGLQVQQIIAEAYTPTKPSTKNMRETRHEEKTKVAQENYSIADRLEPTDSTSTSVPQITEGSSEGDAAANVSVNTEAVVVEDDMDDEIDENAFLQSAIAGSKRVTEYE